MKKILALTLSGILVLGGSGIAIAASATEEGSAAPEIQAESTANTQSNLYLVPGVYTADGEKKLNGIDSGATKLTDEQCEEIFTENAYLCTLTKGAALPVPTSERKDKDGVAYSFNGWWTIVDATVTYFETVPEITETTYLYADWRADLSQRKDPVAPEEGMIVEPNHYIMLKHSDGTEQKVTLIRGFTNLSTAETLGYGFAAELKIEGLTLNPGDTFMVYTTGLVNSDKAELSPVCDGTFTRWTIDLEASSEKDNDTKTYLSAQASAYYTVDPVITYKYDTEGTYNLYIKYFSKGSKMAVYMEPIGLN